MKADGRRNGSRVFTGLLGLLILVVVGGLLVSTILTIAIWPGQVKLVAPFFCTDAQPDAFVVADSYSPRPGETVTNFSLYCMGPRGDATDHGFMKPFLLTAVLNGIVLTLLVILAGLAFRRRRRARITPLGPDETAPGQPTQPMSSTVPRRSKPGPGSTAGPFVD
jgi:hypothetical protein